jgi:squalene cyclase
LTVRGGHADSRTTAANRAGSGDRRRAKLPAGPTAPDGYWWAELESNVTITAEIILLHKIWGTDGDRPLAKAEHYLRSHQRDHGGWELFYGDGGDLSTSVEAYTALRVLGVPASDPALLRAKEFILSRAASAKPAFLPSCTWP